MKVSILDRRYIYIVGCFGPLITPVELSAKEIKQLQQLGYKLELYVPNKPAVLDPSMKIEINIKEVNVNKNETVKLEVMENGVPFKGTVNFTVSDNNIAKVENGVVTGLTEGIAIVSTVHKGVSLMSVITVLKGQEEVQPVAEARTVVEEPVAEVTEPVVEEKVEEVKEEVKEQPKKTTTKKTTTKKK